MSEDDTKQRPDEWPLYQELAAEFDHTFADTRGGFTFDYITGEQATSRLNEALGFLNWSFRIIEHGIYVEADECWVLGELSVTVGDRTVTRQQFGSQKIKRSRQSGVPLDIGFDLKGAATDALKKCASLVGVALYLYEKEPPKDAHAASGPRPMPSSNGGAVLPCEQCGSELTETRFKDGTVWGPDQLAVYGRRKHGRVLCFPCYREANAAQKSAAPQPF